MALKSAHNVGVDFRGILPKRIAHPEKLQYIQPSLTLFDPPNEGKKENQQAVEKRLWKGIFCLTGTYNG
ncbi:MAG: hypothetical protein V3V05_12500 [Pontiella sp.]